jgi:hypothetical protein
MVAPNPPRLARIALRLGALASGATAAGPPGTSTLTKGSLTLKLTEVGPANLLPPFTALSPGGESIEHLEPSIVKQVPAGGTESGAFDISCPDDIFENPLPEANGRHLPYRLLDQYRSERVATAVPTLELADGSGLKVRKTPRWPRSWPNRSLLSLYSDRTGQL